MFAFPSSSVDLSSLKEAISALRSRLEYLNQLHLKTKAGKKITINGSGANEINDLPIGGNLYQMNMDAIKRAIMASVNVESNVEHIVANSYISHNISPTIGHCLVYRASYAAQKSTIGDCIAQISYDRVSHHFSFPYWSRYIMSVVVCVRDARFLSAFKQVLRAIAEGRYKSKNFVDSKGNFALLITDERDLYPNLLQYGIFNIVLGTRFFSMLWSCVHYSPLCPELISITQAAESQIYRYNQMNPDYLINEDDGTCLNVDSAIICPSCRSIIAA